MDAKADARFWTWSTVKIYPVYLDHIPVVAVRFPKENFDFDVSMNFLKVKEDMRDPWLNNEGNVVQFVLIDARTNIVRALRIVGVDFSRQFREECRKQLDKYTTVQEVDIKIAAIQSRYSTSELIQLSR